MTRTINLIHTKIVLQIKTQYNNNKIFMFVFVLVYFNNNF